MPAQRDFKDKTGRDGNVTYVWRGNYIVKSGKHLPWHSTVCVRINILPEDVDKTEIWSHVLFSFPARNTERGTRTISPATCHRARHLSRALVVCGTGMNPFPLASQRLNRQAPPFSISSLFHRLLSALNQHQCHTYERCLAPTQGPDCLPCPWTVSSTVGPVIYGDSGIDYV